MTSTELNNLLEQTIKDFEENEIFSVDGIGLVGSRGIPDGYIHEKFKGIKGAREFAQDAVCEGCRVKITSSEGEEYPIWEEDEDDDDYDDSSFWEEDDYE